MKKYQKHVLSVTGLIVAAAIVFLVLIYVTPLTDPLTSSLKKIFPAKIVGSHMVSIYDLKMAHRLGRRLDPKASSASINEQLIRTEKIRTISGKLGVNLKSDDVADELSFLKTQPDYKQTLESYFSGNEGLFRRFVAYPQTWNSLMSIHYNSKIDLNSEAYAKINSVLIDLASGISFEETAKKYSEDEVTGQLGGDLGFFKHGEIIPELEDAITVGAMGEVNKQVIVSRYGYHVVYPIETALDGETKLWHAKHILIKTSGFETWLDDNIRGIRVTSILD